MPKPINYIIICLLLLTIFTPITSSIDGGTPWWDKNWGYRKKIDIPISTKNNSAIFQPIDTKITFGKKCWTENSTYTSIRVCCWDGERWHELESQIYNLNFDSNNNLKSCNLVFLIPKLANGQEKYYIYYDDEPKNPTKYKDHVDIEESQIHQEPIPGQKTKVDFYSIKQHNQYIYYVAQKGTLLGQKLSQGIVKLKENTKEIKMESANQIAQFSFSYYYKSNDQSMSTTGEKLVSKEITIDGNLMVEFRIKSKSSRNDIETTNTYRYYYCPTDEKKIQVHVKHEALKQCRVGENVDYWDGSYAALTSFKSRSQSIDALNFGELLPYLNVYTKEGIIKEFKLNKNPNNKEPNLFLSALDSCEFGKKAWVSYEDQQKAHSIILSSNKSIVKKGENEEDGVQVRGFQIELINIPGLEADFSQTHLLRNSYRNGEYDRVIPEGFTVEFNAEFYTTKNKEENPVESEADIFQSLVKLHQNNYEKSIESEENNKETHNLTVFTDFTPTFPLGSFLSVATGKNFSYISVELYRDGRIVSSGATSRLATNVGAELTLKNKTVFSKLKTMLNLFDRKNFSFFKSIRFSNIPSGNYVIKVYREHPYLSDEKRQLVDIKGIELKKDTSIHSVGTKSKKVKLNIIEENEGEDIQNVKIKAFLDGICITEKTTDKTGQANFLLTCKPFNSYTIKGYYKGFKIFEKEIKPRLLAPKDSIDISFKNKLYDLKTKIVDIFGFPIAINPNLILTSKEMEEKTILSPNEVEQGVFNFSNLYPANYLLKASYKSFELEKDIEIKEESKRSLKSVFPAKFNLNIKVFNSVGEKLSNKKVTVARKGKDISNSTNQNGIATFVLPPGEYRVQTKNSAVQKEVTGDTSTKLVTKEKPILFQIMPLFLLCLVGLSFLFLFLRRLSLSVFLKIIAISLVLLSVVTPWWELNGVNNSIDVSRNVEVFPYSQKLVTTTCFNGEKILDIATIPQIFDLFLLATLLLTIVITFSLVLSASLEIFKKKQKTLNYLFGVIAVLLITVLTLFSVGMEQFCQLGIGNVIGEGSIGFTLPYTSNYVEVPANWGFSIGFYSCFASLGLIFLANLFSRKNIDIFDMFKNKKS